MNNDADISHVPEPGKCRTGAAGHRRDQPSTTSAVPVKTQNSTYEFRDIHLTPMVGVKWIAIS
jgi:hypothetical protein